MITKRELHPCFSRLTSSGNELEIAGLPVTEIVGRAGRTPCYVYDRTAVTRRIAELRETLPRRVRVHYALKANPMPALIGHIASAVDGFDVASHQEMILALNAGATPTAISFAGPAKSDAEITSALSAGVSLICESEIEILRIAKFAIPAFPSPRILIRVNPSFELKGAGMKMSGSPRPFGIDEDRIPAAIEALRSQGIEPAGLHIYCGSQCLNAATIIEANKRTLELACSISQSANLLLSDLNIGGGYGIPYFPRDSDLDIRAIGEALDSTLRNMDAYLATTKIIVELGRYIVGEAGYYLTRVVDIKRSFGQTFLIVDGGLHHHLANSGNFGQTLRRNYPVLSALRLNEPNTELVNISGPLCTPLDVVGDNIYMPPPRVGDLIAVLQSGAYGYSASPLNFLSHPPPIEILL